MVSELGYNGAIMRRLQRDNLGFFPYGLCTLRHSLIKGGVL